MEFIFSRPYIITFIIAWLFADYATLFMRFVARRMKVLDLPSPRKLQRTPIPRLGGIAIYTAFMVAITMSLQVNFQLFVVMVAATAVVILGAVDDFKSVTPLIKLPVLALITLGMAIFGVQLTLFPNPFLNLVVTLFWVAGVMSAFNAIDNMDGEAAGIACIASLAFAIISFQTGQKELGFLASGLAGGCLGFLRWNIHPAHIFMGDSGSYFVGFVLAVMGMVGNWHQNVFQASLIPLIILGIPLFDFAFVMITLFWTKKVRNIVEAIVYCGKVHVAHRLLSLGSSQLQTAFLLYFLGCLLGLTAIACRILPFQSAVVLFLMIVMAFVGMGIALARSRAD